jgi:alpha-1,2-mannosyltransferase
MADSAPPLEPRPLSPLTWWSLAVAAGLVFGPLWLSFLYPPRSHILDFFQDWSSARCFFQGLSIYTPLEESAERFLGLDIDPARTHLGRQSTHPPASVLLVLPLAVLGYPEAFLIWNLLSLGCGVASVYLIWREIGPPWPGAGLGLALAVALAASPLLEQVHHAQINLVLLLLTVAGWRAMRRQEWGWAGALLGSAAAVKLMPAYLFLVPLVRRQWMTLLAGGAAFFLWTGVAYVLFGPDAFRKYQAFMLPHLELYRSDWLNASFFGFFSRLFDVGPAGARAEPILTLPLVAKVLTWLGAIAVTLLAGGSAWRAKDSAQLDAAWGLTLTAMLLASPFTWEHYLVLLVPALWLAWQRARTLGDAVVLGLIMVGLLLHPAYFWSWTVPPGFGQAVAQPWQSLTVVAVKFYALVGFCAWQWRRRV